MRKWYRTGDHAVRTKTLVSKYRKANPEKCAAAIRNWADKNPERVRAIKTKHHRKQRMQNPVKERLANKKQKAGSLGVAFNLTEDWFLAHFSQGCELTGHDLVLDGKSPWSAEIDRIIPGGAYTMDNCRIVCAIYNRARMAWSDESVYTFAELLLGNK